jgi:hypothetical protein
MIHPLLVMPDAFSSHWLSRKAIPDVFTAESLASFFIMHTNFSIDKQMRKCSSCLTLQGLRGT